MMAEEDNENESAFDNMTNEELGCLAQDRDDAEKAGLFNDDHIYDCVDGYAKKFTVEQEMALHSAVSDLSYLMKETNSSLSDLLKVGGLIDR